MPQRTAIEPVTTPPQRDCLAPSWFIDSDAPEVVAYAEKIVSAADAGTDRQKAVALFNAVRDGWRYDPYNVSYRREDFRASAVLTSDSNWCVPKSVLLTALCRSVGIPAGLGFADVRNHLQSAKLLEKMGTDLFVYHGYSVIWIDGAWRKASSAFNRELCERFGTKVLEFNGHDDALMHAYDEAGNRHMEYVNYHGDLTDLPLDDLFAAFEVAYGTSFRDGHDHDVIDEAFNA